jgi:S-adenosylmethionine-diacylgycerolhomoserine-N-methlytransferase
LIDTHEEHRAFLNRYYGVARHFYDVTRKYYLFGRDVALRRLIADPTWTRLVEIGPGTGRNLSLLHRARPDAVLGGIEASDSMLEYARRRCGWARIEHGFAETAPLGSIVGQPADRILFSYCLSMVGDKDRALAQARRSLAPGGKVVVVDFADFGGMPPSLARAFRSYLRTFHVEPLADAVIAQAESVTFGLGRYYVIATFEPL